MKDSEEKIILYTTGCPRCRLLERQLDEKGIKYEKSDDVEILIENGFSTVPVLFVNNKILTFPKSVKYINNI